MYKAVQLSNKETVVIKGYYKKALARVPKHIVPTSLLPKRQLTVSKQGLQNEIRVMRYLGSSDLWRELLEVYESQDKLYIVFTYFQG